MTNDLDKNEKIKTLLDKFEEIGDNCVKTIRIIEKRIESRLKEFERKMSLNFSNVCMMDINKKLRMDKKYCNLTECSGAHKRQKWIDERIELSDRNDKEMFCNKTIKDEITDVNESIERNDFGIVKTERCEMEQFGKLGKFSEISERENTEDDVSKSLRAKVIREGDNEYLVMEGQIIFVPELTEQILKFHFDQKETYVCEEQEVEKDVWITDELLMRNEKSVATLSILNLGNKGKMFTTIRLKLKRLREYNVLHFHCNLEERENRIQKLLHDVNLEHLEMNIKRCIENICIENNDIFYVEGDRLSCSSAVKHEIPINNNRPIYVRQYRLPEAQREIMNEKIKKMLEDGMIEHSYSPWNFPTLLVAKKSDSENKKWRLVVDYRKLNEVSVPDSFPLPNITDILDQLGGALYFSTLDLASGYHQLLVDERDRAKTAFSTNMGHFEYVRLPMGLMNSGRTFQRLLNRVLEGMVGKDCFVYLDDIVVYGSSLEEHNERLLCVFDRLRKYNLKLQSEKCKLLKREVVYLGHLISASGIRPDPNKTACVTSYPVPKNIGDIRSFLGFASYYRRFIERFSDIARPMLKLLRKGTKFCWTDECQNSFERFKEILTSPPLLQYPNFQKQFILTTDASTFALGAILSQGESVGKDLPVAYASRTLNSAEMNYTVTELELLAIMYGIKQFRPYLWGRKFKIVTDHQPLTWIFNVKDPSSRLLRWRIKLEEYDFEIIYKTGKTNKNADALSRIRQGDNFVNVITRSTTRRETENAKSIIDDNNGATLNGEGDVDDNGVVEEFGENLNLEYISEKLYTGQKFFNRIHLISNDASVLSEKSMDDQRFELGDVIHRVNKNGNHFYLIVKDEESLDMKVESLWDAFRNLRDVLIQKKISTVSMIKTDDYLENLDYEVLKRIILDCFASVGLKIYIYIKKVRELRDDEEIDKILNDLHFSKIGGHIGTNRLERKIRERYTFPNLRKKVIEVVNGCEECKKNKH